MCDDLLTPEVREIGLTLMEGLGCPRAVTVAIMLRYHMWSELMALDIKPYDYQDASTYRRAAAATKFLSKLEVTVPGLDPAKAALDKWEQSEKACFLSNQRINSLMDFGSLDPKHERLRDFIAAVRKNVEKLIGSAPPAIVDGTFGPGATVSDSSGYTTVPHKLSSTPSLTSEAIFYLVPWTGTKWAESCALRSEAFSFVRGNQYFQVPKNAKTHRSCAKEPSINAFYQRGYGKIMANRLTSAGLLIKPVVNPMLSKLGIHLAAGHGDHVAKDVHMRVACEASRFESFATIDLSSASDTICTALVRHVLPRSWYECLDQLRSPYTLVNNRWRRLEKFSSMGNGFTFELETAIFSAVCMAVDPSLEPGKDLFVFGDDIIVPTAISESVINALEYCGFELNVEKTFTSGPFRESCGGDFWNGSAVRPYHLKGIPNAPQDYISLANGIRRLANQDILDDHLLDDLRPAWFRTLDCIPFAIRCCRGPIDLGDLVIHDDERYWRTRDRANSIRYISVYRPVGLPKVAFRRFSPDIQLASALYGVSFIEKGVTPAHRRVLPEGVDLRHLPIRGPVSGYKVGWVPFS